VSKHGHKKGGKASPTYGTWTAMHQRCRNPKHKSYPDYGGKGITVCDEWTGRGGFERFLEHVGERPEGCTLHRIDSTKGYEPGNVTWATASEQNAYLLYAGGTSVTAVGPDGRKRTMSLYRWAKFLNIKYRSLCRRIQRGWKEEAFRTRGGKQRKR
jgi:hypothetical protein